MKEILTTGNVEQDFKRLGINLKQTYKGVEYGVCEVTDDEFQTLCNEEDNIKNIWEKCGWVYCEGSNQEQPTKNVVIMNKNIIAWNDNVGINDKYNNLLQYLCINKGASQTKNVCALTKDLAKYNNMKLSELFFKYQG